MNSIQILLASNTNASSNMAEAFVRLRTVFPTGIHFSEIVSSTAVNKAGESIPDGGQYLNALCLAYTELPLAQAIESLKTIELEMGRIRGAEVAIDLDLVVWNKEILRPWEAAQAFYLDCLRSIDGHQS